MHQGKISLLRSRSRSINQLKNQSHALSSRQLYILTRPSSLHYYVWSHYWSPSGGGWLVNVLPHRLNLIGATRNKNLKLEPDSPCMWLITVKHLTSQIYSGYATIIMNNKYYFSNLVWLIQQGIDGGCLDGVDFIWWWSRFFLVIFVASC